MLIKNKIILGFLILSGVLMVLFSIYIFVTYKDFREKVFYESLKTKSFATTEIYDKNDTLSERIITSMTEQSEYVFDGNFKRIFFVNPMNDVAFDNTFFKKLANRNEYRFHYKSGDKKYDKEGLAISFLDKGVKKYAVITAYNLHGYEMQDKLKSILIYGNVILIFLMGIAGYLLSYFALKPLNKLVHEIEAIKPNDLNVKLTDKRSNDEVAFVANSFNGLLAKINALVETQRSFIGYASHELRTPLAAISGILETSVKYDKNIEDIKESSMQASKELDKLILLTNELLQLSKIESIEAKVELMPINILELLMDLINVYKKRNNDQKFDLFISDRFAVESNSIVVLGNEDLLKTAIGNIIDNAIKYSDGKRIFLKVQMNTNEEIKISLTDSGIGIENEDIHKIFNPMTRGGNTGKKEGYGLGLTLTKKIIDMHNGRVEIKSKPEEGTEVSVFLNTYKS